MTNKKTKQSARGFTLIETLVAILILTTAVAGPLTIVQKGLTASLVAKDQTVAFNLAQDAVEYVRFVRDNNRLAGGGDWLAGLDTSGCTSADGSSACRVDSIQNTTAPCAGACPVLNYDSSNQDYTYSAVGVSVVPGIFTRTIRIKTSVDGNPDQAELTVTVAWTDQGTLVRNVLLRENLFNWQ